MGKVKLKVIYTEYGKEVCLEDNWNSVTFPQRGKLLSGLRLEEGDIVELTARKVKK